MQPGGREFKSPRLHFFIIMKLFFFLFSQVITFIHLNDTHTHLVPHGNWVNGEKEYRAAASAATIIKNLKNLYPDAILAHAGDAFVGDLIHNVLKGKGELTFLKSLGIRIFTIGNHEFDYGSNTLYNTLLKLGLPDNQTTLLSANLIYNGHPLQSLIKPYEIDTVNDVIIGYVGLVTQIPTVLLPNLAPIIVDDPVEYARMYKDTLNALGCHLKVLVSHLGVELDTYIAKTTPDGYQLIIGGHTHTKLQNPLIVKNPSGDTVWVVQAHEHYKCVGFLQMDLSSGKPKLINYSLIPVDFSVPYDSTSLTLIQQFKDSVNLYFGKDMYGTFIGFSDTLIEHRFIENSPYKDSPLGNLVTDAMRDTLKTDIALELGFLLGEPIYQGLFSEADLYRAVPYGYDSLTKTNLLLVKSYFYGDTLIKILNFTLKPFVYPFLLPQT